MDRYSPFVFGGLLLLASCESQVAVHESKLTGAWHRVSAHKADYPNDNDIIMYKRGKHLLLTTYYSHHEAELNKTGDSITLRQGCEVLLLPITLKSASSRKQDTLSVVGFGRFIRMDSTAFLNGYRTFIREHHAKTKLMKQTTYE